MPTPVKISANPPDVEFNATNAGSGFTSGIRGWEDNGPFLVGNNLYVVVVNDTDYDAMTGLAPVQVYKSADLGATWTAQDIGNQPGASVKVVVILVGAVLQVFSGIPEPTSGTGRTLAYQEFDTVTDTWGAQDVAPIAVDPDLDYLDLQVTTIDTNGDSISVYKTSTPAGSTGLRRRVGGVWQEPVAAFQQVGVAASLNPINSFQYLVDDSTYVLWKRVGLDVATNGFYVGRITNGDVVSAPSLIYLDNTLPFYVFGQIAVWNGVIVVAGYDVTQPRVPGVWEGSPIGVAPVWTFQNPGVTTEGRGRVGLTVRGVGELLLWYTTGNLAATPDSNQVWYASYTGSGVWGAPVLFYDWNTNPPAGNLTDPADQSIEQPTVLEVSPGNFAAALTLAFNAAGDEFSGFAFLLPGLPRTLEKLTGGGARYFPRYLNRTLLNLQLSRKNPVLSAFYLFPNDHDVCLIRDWTLYNRIDREALGCKRKPECFLRDERMWTSSPAGGIIFNLADSIPLPAPIDGDVVVLSFRVPMGYDGVILGQYHNFTGGFTEGSGDLVWRVRVDGRYLKDCGEMTVTMGNPRQISPVYGGLLLLSGNFVEYLVSAPNAGGSLPPPGTGNILVGLHGWHFPR